MVANPSFGIAISFFEVKTLVETIKLESISVFHCKFDGSDRVFTSENLKVQTKASFCDHGMVTVSMKFK